MAFALQKSDNQKKSQKRSPLAGWLGRGAVAEEDTPELDVAGGLNRALKGAKVAETKPVVREQQSPVREALGAIEAALYAIDRIRDTLEQASEIVLSAKDIDEAGGRALLAERYDEMRLSIDTIIQSIDPRAASLIGGAPRHMDVNLGGKTRYSVSSSKLDTSATGLNLSPPHEAFSSDVEIDNTLAELDTALGRADRAAAGYCRDAQFLIARMNGAFE